MRHTRTRIAPYSFPLVELWPRLQLYAFPPIGLLLGVLERVPQEGVQLLYGSSVLACPSMVLGPNSYSGRPSMGNSHQERPSDSGLGLNISPPTGNVEIMGVAPEGDQLLNEGLSTEVVENI